MFYRELRGQGVAEIQGELHGKGRGLYTHPHSTPFRTYPAPFSQETAAWHGFDAWGRAGRSGTAAGIVETHGGSGKSGGNVPLYLTNFSINSCGAIAKCGYWR